MTQCNVKKLFYAVTILAITFMLVTGNHSKTVYAADTSVSSQDVTIEKITDDLYCITTIETTINGSSDKSTAATRSSKTKSGSKTVKYQNSNGTTLWYVKVSGDFSYNGSSSRCTSASVSAASYDKNWTISNKSSSKSGKTATATATGTLNKNSLFSQTITKTVSLSCSKNGKLS
ncbi:hypothetical protein D3Z47_02305 [Lachnospiraceae bacterium]|nr:hypothetical protein [Lachnospiraceae bacterium]